MLTLHWGDWIAGDQSSQSLCQPFSDICVHLCVFLWTFHRVWLVRIHLSVCVCRSVCVPPCPPPDPDVNVRLPTKNQLGFNEARTPCAPHWTLNTHCTNRQNTKTTPKLLCSVLTVIIHAHCMLHTVDAASTKCTAETWPTAQCALVHLQNNTYTLHTG